MPRANRERGEQKMATQDTPRGTRATPEAFQDKIVAQIKEAEARIQQFEGKVREKRLQAEIAAVNGLKAARLNIERKLKDLATTQESQIARAKADIDAAAGALKTSLDEFGRKLSTLSDDVTRTDRSSWPSRSGSHKDSPRSSCSSRARSKW
jgi:hypothetical protein